MESVFTLAKTLGKDKVDDIVKLLRDGLLEGPGNKEQYIRSQFRGIPHIEYEHFMVAMTRYCESYGVTMEEATEMLLAKAPPVLRMFHSDPKICPPHQSTCSTETETELSNEHFFDPHHPNHSHH